MSGAHEDPRDGEASASPAFLRAVRGERPERTPVWFAGPSGPAAAADVDPDATRSPLDAGRPASGLAASVLKTASEKGVIKADDAMSARMLQAAGQRQARAIAGAAAAAKSPTTALDAGNAYSGAGQYPQAIAAFTTAEKGPNAAEATMFKGIAQVRSGNVAAAKGSFGNVNSGDMGEVAGLWQLYTSTKS